MSVRGKASEGSAHVFGVGFAFGGIIDVECVAAIGAAEAHVGPEQGRGHGAGWNHEGFDDEGAENEGEDEGHQDRLDRFLDVGLVLFGLASGGSAGGEFG